MGSGPGWHPEGTGHQDQAAASLRVPGQPSGGKSRTRQHGQVWTKSRGTDVTPLEAPDT